MAKTFSDDKNILKRSGLGDLAGPFMLQWKILVV